MITEGVKKKGASLKGLTGSMLELDGTITRKLAVLRSSLYSSSALSKLEARVFQRNYLAEILDVDVNYIANLEAGKITVPACVILRLIQHFSLSVDFFTCENSSLPSSFITEQSFMRISEEITHLQSLSIQQASTRAANPAIIKKGGWIKGVPRHPVTEKQLALRSVWEAAKQNRQKFTTIFELVNWGKRVGLPEAAGLPTSPEAYKAKPEKERRSLRLMRLRGVERKAGGWLKGVPRSPRNSEEQEILTAWQASRKLHLVFSELSELKAWWEENKASFTS